MININSFFRQKQYTAIPLFIVFAVVLLAGVIACNKKDKTFILPDSNGNPDEILKEVRSAGDIYKSYAISKTNSQIQVPALSVNVISKVKRFQSLGVGNRAMHIQVDSLRPNECKSILDSTKNYLGRRFKVLDSARYKCLVIVHNRKNGDVLHFDHNGVPSMDPGTISISLLLLDTKYKIILWYSDDKVSLDNNLADVTGLLYGFISGRMDLLFKEKQ